jgi:hypothetical protein
MNRTTRKEVEGVFRLWLSGIKGREAMDYNDVGGYRLDYNSVYGGYRVERICNAQGGVSDVFTTRLKAWEFVTALRVSMRSIEEMRLNTKEVSHV